MNVLAGSLFVAVVSLFALPASAAIAFKCTAVDGTVSFQDRPCRATEKTQKLDLSDKPSPNPGLPRNAPTQPARMPASDSPAVAATAIHAAAPPSGFLCTRDDGSRYLSDDGIGESRAVPLAMLGVPGRSLGDAYGGSNGIGVSAPGLRTIPADNSLQGQIGSAYVWIEDPCEYVDGHQICAHLSAQIADAERRLRFAFSDTSAQVEAEISVLRTRAADCPN
jgi:hypothetical protein